MKIITIDAGNIDKEHICCAIGNDKENSARAATKKAWMKERFADGLVFNRLDARGKFFIEYMPIEKVWKPVIGKNNFVINCLWVSGQYKGQGHAGRLLDTCIQDATKQKKDGVAVVTSRAVKPFLTDKKFYLHHGFAVVDEAPPYFELLWLKLTKTAQAPKFTDHAKGGSCANKTGLTFIYANQCPFMDEYVARMAGIAKAKGVTTRIQKLRDHKDAQKTGSPFGTLGIYHQGKLVAHELIPDSKFPAFLASL